MTNHTASITSEELTSTRNDHPSEPPTWRKLFESARRVVSAAVLVAIAFSAFVTLASPPTAAALEPADGAFNQRRFRVEAGSTVDVAVPMPYDAGPVEPLCLIDGYHSATDDDMGWYCTWRYDARTKRAIFTIHVFGAGPLYGRFVTGTATLVNRRLADVSYIDYDTAFGDPPTRYSGVVETVRPRAGEVLLNMVRLYDPQGNDDFGYRFERNHDGDMELRVGPAVRNGRQESGRLAGSIVRIRARSADRAAWKLGDLGGDVYRYGTSRYSSTEQPTLCLSALEGLGSKSTLRWNFDRDFSAHFRPTGAACAHLDARNIRRASKGAPIDVEFWSADGNDLSVADVALVVLSLP